MTDGSGALRDVRGVLLVDWPTRDVPDSLVRAGFDVVAQEGPGRYVAYEVKGGQVQPRELPDRPDRADLVYMYRPIDELHDVLALATVLGARHIWFESSDTPTDADLDGARTAVEASGMTLIEGRSILDAVRSVRRVGRTLIRVLIGDITGAPVEAIVNAANSELWMGGGVAGAIKRAAGAEVESEAMAQGPIQPGESVVTPAGRLPAPIRWVVHAATMGPDLQTSEAYIARATASALAAAARAGAGSIALPALGTGVGGFPVARAAELMVGEALRSAEAGSQLAEIIFVVRDETAAAAFRSSLAALGARSGT